MAASSARTPMAPCTPWRIGVDEELVVGEGVVEDVAEEDVDRVLGACDCGLSTSRASRESAESLASAEECALNEFSNMHE